MILSKFISVQGDTARAAGCCIEKIDRIPRQFTGVYSLIMPDNPLKSLKNIEQFTKLTYINIENNRLATIDAIKPLSKCTNLKSILIRGNPIAKFDLFVPYLLSICPSIEVIDGRKVDNSNQLENLVKINIEQTLLTHIESICPIIDALKISTSGSELTTDISINLVVPQKDLVNLIRKKNFGLTFNKYYPNLRDLILRLHKIILKLGIEAKIPSKVIQRHNYLIQELYITYDLQNIFDLLPNLYESVLKFITAEKEAGENTDVHVYISSEKAIETSDVFPMNNSEKSSNAKQQEGNIEDSEGSFEDEKINHNEDENHNDTLVSNDIASDEEKPAQQADDKSKDDKKKVDEYNSIDNDQASDEEKTMNSESDVPTEIKRHPSVTFLQNNTLMQHKDDMLFDASQGEALTSSTVPIKVENDNSEVSDFERKPQPEKSPVRKTSLLVQSSEFFASRGESMDSQPQIAAKICYSESVYSDFEKPRNQSTENPTQNQKQLLMINDSKFEGDCGEYTTEKKAADAINYDSDSASAFPGNSVASVIKNPAKYFTIWKKKFRSQIAKRKEELLNSALISYINANKYKEKIEMQKLLNTSLQKEVSSIKSKISDLNSSGALSVKSHSSRRSLFPTSPTRSPGKQFV